ncbi:MAG TPA: DUF456 domain-containing protein [Kineosporiaceae bacterium]|nr:DUF456 domain-containing protein [Kineosporiaceae bacterium]
MTLLSGLMIVIGLAGIVVPVLPGLLLVWGGVAVWAFERSSATGWTILAVATALAVGGSLAKYWWPGRRLRESGVPATTLAAGALLAVVGLFVVPVIGAVLGFVLGVYLAQWHRLGNASAAWPSTRAALAAVGWSVAIEATAALLITATWLIGVLAT